MAKLHICNTFFEKELEEKMALSLREWVESSPIFLQLQFLPILYAKKEDLILVSHLPEKKDPRFCLIEDPPKGYEISHWGPSSAIEKWAKEHHLDYPAFDASSLREMNAKPFCFERSTPLLGAKLLTTEKEIACWLDQTPNPKVLKTPFGTSGNGHIFNPKTLKEIPLKKGPFIAEPWVEKIEEFSSQWENKKLIGITSFETNRWGAYKKTTLQKPAPWALEEHLKKARPLIEEIANRGYTGSLGIDAFTYLENNIQKVHPISEINLRKTMSWIALEMGAKTLIFEKKTEGLLPNRLGKILFPKNVQFS